MTGEDIWYGPRCKMYNLVRELDDIGKLDDYDFYCKGCLDPWDHRCIYFNQNNVERAGLPPGRYKD